MKAFLVLISTLLSVATAQDDVKFDAVPKLRINMHSQPQKLRSRIPDDDVGITEFEFSGPRRTSSSYLLPAARDESYTVGSEYEVVRIPEQWRRVGGGLRRDRGHRLYELVKTVTAREEPHDYYVQESRQSQLVPFNVYPREHHHHEGRTYVIGGHKPHPSYVTGADSRFRIMPVYDGDLTILSPAPTPRQRNQPHLLPMPKGLKSYDLDRRSYLASQFQLGNPSPANPDQELVLGSSAVDLTVGNENVEKGGDEGQQGTVLLSVAEPPPAIDEATSSFQRQLFEGRIGKDPNALGNEENQLPPAPFTRPQDLRSFWMYDEKDGKDNELELGGGRG